MRLALSTDTTGPAQDVTLSRQSSDLPTPEKLAAFGKEYLDEVLSFDQAIARASSDLEWDLDAKEAMDFIKKCAE